MRTEDGRDLDSAIEGLEARVAALTQEKEQFRIEADCAIRDYDALELDAGIMAEALQDLVNSDGFSDEEAERAMDRARKLLDKRG